jgi:hypothetical protein
MFKVGDMVAAIESVLPFFRSGDVGTIISIDDTDRMYFVQFIDAYGPGRWFVRLDNVRDVTKLEKLLNGFDNETK